MPLHHQPQTLKQCSLRVIAENFEAICYNCRSVEEMDSLIESGDYLNCKSNIYNIPSHLIADLAEELKHITHLRCHHLHTLITPMLLEWNSDGISDQMMAFHLIKTRCEKLKHLNMGYVRHLNYKVFLNLLPSLNTLVMLDLRMTLTVDEIMGKIGEFCTQLVDLNLSGTPITDKGLIQLCVAENGTRKCQKLVRLSVEETWVTSAGATVVLQSLPNLKDFDFENMFEALEQVEMWDQHIESNLLSRAGLRMSEVPSKTPTQLKITSLISTTEFVREEAFESAVRLCPDITAISISNAWLSSESLYKFMVLEQLNKLSLTNSEGLTFDFHEGVLPLLSACGVRLQSLILANFPVVDILAIGRACPILQNLAFSKVSIFELPSQLHPELFNNLEAMELWSETQIEINPNLVKQLLQFSPMIRNILFNGCSVLSDKLFDEIWEKNPMKKLSHITLDHCHNVTMSTLHDLLDKDNELNVLRVWSCASINKTHSLQISQRLMNENMDIYFEWFSI
uniref:F-box domain-containing protein n=1 Tax=Clastoptera arizonana TaxID=38151 RepID=A0A1B6D6M4_9HEMI